MSKKDQNPITRKSISVSKLPAKLPKNPITRQGHLFIDKKTEIDGVEMGVL